jgi:hypothetical protein
MKEGFVSTLSLTMTLVCIFLFNQLIYTSSNDPYESGYDQGCDDAGISNPSDRYINQPERGPAFHTDKFMDTMMALTHVLVVKELREASPIVSMILLQRIK